MCVERGGEFVWVGRRLTAVNSVRFDVVPCMK